MHLGNNGNIQVYIMRTYRSLFVQASRQAGRVCTKTYLLVQPKVYTKTYLFVQMHGHLSSVQKGVYLYRTMGRGGMAGGQGGGRQAGGQGGHRSLDTLRRGVRKGSLNL